MRKYLGFVAVLVFLLSCTNTDRDNPNDEPSKYIVESSAEGSSSSVGTYEEPSSSSVVPSSGSVGLSSSSTPPSSSSVVPSSSSSVGGNGDGSSVAYEGQTYRTVKIGTQTWFAENLNYAVAGSKCYGEGGEVVIGRDENNNPITKTLSPAEVQAYCVKYGRLYNWVTAMDLPPECDSIECSSQIQSPHRGICPSGWHLPSNADWDKLYRYADGTSGTSSPYFSPTAGKHLKAQSGWNPYSSIENLDTYGFSALPGGNGYSDGSFYSVGDLGLWWSASENNSYSAYRRFMLYNYDSAIWDGYYNSYLQSVRCLQD